MDYGFYLKTYAPDFDKLLGYGFCREGDAYILAKDLSENGLYMRVEITETRFEVRVIDRAFDDDFLPFSVKNGSSPVKSEAERLVEEIVGACFVSIDVTKNLVAYLEEKYGTKHEEPWEDSPGDYTFKTPNSKKWYAIIMHIPGKRIGLETENAVDIINFKIDPAKISALVDNKHYFYAYHMNKKNWITVLLDKDTDMQTLKVLLDDNFRMVEKPPRASRQWIVPANPKYYDVDKAIAESPENFEWKQSNNIQAGDVVYLYIAAPVSAIKYKCAVLKTGIPYEYADENLRMQYVMQLKLIKAYREPIPFAFLKRYGVSAVRGPRSLPQKLVAAIESVQ